MEAIRHKLVIKEAPAKIFDAITTEEGIKGWWAKQTIAKPQVGFVNVFTFENDRNEFRVTELVPNRKVEWLGVQAFEEWIDTTISFNLEEKDGKTVLRFAHSGWKAATDTFAVCSYDWAQFLRSLKSFCETGTGSPA